MGWVGVRSQFLRSQFSLGRLLDIYVYIYILAEAPLTLSRYFREGSEAVFLHVCCLFE